MAAAKQVIVIGAGIIGASIAWHLTKAGARVTVISGSGAGGVATPNSFAWINASWGNPEVYFRLRTRAMAEWKRLANELPGLPLAWCGGLCWDLPADRLEAYAAEHSSWGYGIERVDAKRAAQIEPNLVEPPEFAVYVAEEGVAEPVATTKALLADAERQGAKIITGAVTALVHSNGKVSGVEISGRRIAADEVVIAAGTGAPTIAATAGIKLPIETPPGLIVHSRPYKKLLNGLVHAERLHMRRRQRAVSSPARTSPAAIRATIPAPRRATCLRQRRRRCAVAMGWTLISTRSATDPRRPMAFRSSAAPTAWMAFTSRSCIRASRWRRRLDFSPHAKSSMASATRCWRPTGWSVSLNSPAAGESHR